MTTIAILPGSYDPITNGHLEIIGRASLIADEVIIALARHPTKPGYFPMEVRKELILAATLKKVSNLTVEIVDGLMFEFARETAQKYHAQVMFVRGLRPQGDFASEYLLAMGNRDAAPEIETVFLMSSPTLSHVSSSLVREMASHGADISRYVVPEVAEAMKQANAIRIRNQRSTA